MLPYMAYMLPYMAYMLEESRWIVFRNIPHAIFCSSASSALSQVHVPRSLASLIRHFMCRGARSTGGRSVR